VIVVAGFLVGFVPALKAYRTSLLDGLAPRA
jgi:putative ABC transport system permease protein